MSTESLKKLLSLSPKAFFRPLVLLHGTSKDNLHKIFTEGLQSYDGYSIVTLNSNVAYSLYAKQEMAYGASGKREDSKGILLVLLPTLYPGPGHNAEVFLDEENKNINGHMPMWIKGNLGFYLSKNYECNPKKQISINPKSIIAGLSISRELENGFKEIKKTVEDGKINTQKWNKYFFDYFSIKPKELFQPKLCRKIATGLVEATIVSQIVEVVRRATLSLALHQGWSIRGTSLGSDRTKKKSKEGISVYFSVEYKKGLSNITLPTIEKVKKQVSTLEQLTRNRENPALEYSILSFKELRKFLSGD